MEKEKATLQQRANSNQPKTLLKARPQTKSILESYKFLLVITL